jgi:monofunctional biosynthetic peptidoglycan transglycosylase
MSSKRHKRSLVNRLKVVVTWMFCAWLAVVVLYRFIRPPTTPLIVIRTVERLMFGGALSRSRRWVSLSELSLPVQQAIVTAEDARFMSHWGVDISAVGMAIDDSDGRRRLRGASTITMQTVKNLFLWPGRSYLRKLVEAVMAPIAGLVWGKRRTLELYVNVIEWGPGIYGIEAASHEYFHHSAKELTVSEAAALAAILPNPRKLSPQRMSHPTRRRYERIIREWQGAQVPAVRAVDKGRKQGLSTRGA